MSKTKWYTKPIYVLVALALVLSLGIMALPMAGTAEANPDEWYVDGALGTDGGAPQGTGPGALAFKTIQYAINDGRVAVGDTINVAAGTYTEQVTINKDNLTIQSTDSAANTIINATGKGTSNGGVIFDADGCTFDGFTVRDFTDDPNENKIIRVNGDNNVVQNNIIQGNLNQSGISDKTEYGILFQSTASGNLIDSNEVYDIGYTGINVAPDKGTSSNTIRDNNVHHIGIYGISLDRSPDNTVTGNQISNLIGGNLTLWGSPGNYDPAVWCWGIIVWGEDADGNRLINQGVMGLPNGIVLSSAHNTLVEHCNISGNAVTGLKVAESSWAGGVPTGNMVRGCDIKNNAEGVHIAGTIGSGNEFQWNNIEGNTGPGTGMNNTSGVEVNAEFNWWGAKDGPGGVGPGSGDAVSDDVDYAPWLGAELTEVEFETIDGSGTMHDTPTGGDITIDATGNHTITAAKYANNPGGPCPFANEGSYYDVHLDDATNVTSLTIQFCPAQENEVICYWDGTSCLACSNQVYSNGCIVVTITDETQPSLSDLTGLPFGKGSVLPPVGGEAYPVNKASVLAPWIVLAVLLAGGISWFTLRRRRAQS